MAPELEVELGEVGYRVKSLPPCDEPRRGACPCCIAALVDESADYGSLQETLANTELPCFQRPQP